MQEIREAELCRKKKTLYLQLEYILITQLKKTYNKMDKYVCTVCQYEYDPEQGDPDNGIAPGTAFEDLPDDWVCPLCGVGKEDFEKAS